MFRVKDLEKSLDFFVSKLGLVETRRKEVESGRFTLVFIATKVGDPELELTYNWPDEKTNVNETYSIGRNFGHVAFEVDDIYETCDKLQRSGVKILRPPKDGYMCFIRSPDGQSVELLQKGSRLEPKEPWKSMSNEGEW
jgi:lactoylglutathione lyase